MSISRSPENEAGEVADTDAPTIILKMDNETADSIEDILVESGIKRDVIKRTVPSSEGNQQS